MSKPDPLHVVAEVIDKAAEKKGWSLAQLARVLDKGNNTLFRWRAAKASSIDLRSVVQLFEMAEVSMDQSFGLGSSGKQGNLEDIRILEMQEELAEIKEKLAAVEPVAQLIRSLGTSMMAASLNAEEEEVRRIRAEIPSDSTLRKAISKAREIGEAEKKPRRRKSGAKQKRA